MLHLLDLLAYANTGLTRDIRFIFSPPPLIRRHHKTCNILFGGGIVQRVLGASELTTYSTTGGIIDQISSDLSKLSLIEGSLKACGQRSNLLIRSFYLHKVHTID